MRTRRLRGLGAVAVIVAVLTPGCIFGGGGGNRTYHAQFSRAVQLFVAGEVRVLGVDVGTITNIQNESNGVEVTFTVNNDVKIPANVDAAIVPVSLLGERYVQLFPAYRGGPTLPAGSTIGAGHTSVPAEPDELLRSLQNYMGALNPHTVSRFVENAARILQGNGAKLNTLIGHGAGVLSELAAKRADLSQIIVQFDKLSTVLSSRERSVANLIQAYNSVAGTLVTNRSALEGTITGLRDASLELANLLIAHRAPLHADIANLTSTAQVLSKNVGRFADTGHWADLLFHAAQRAVDYNHKWLRLNNQGQEIGAMIMMRLQERFVELCNDLGLPTCSAPSYWAQHVPSMFCFKADSKCGPAVHGNQVKQLVSAINQVPALVNALLERAMKITCTNAAYPSRCLRRKALLIKCAKSADPARCLEKHAILLKCLKSTTAETVDQCIAANKEADVKKIVNQLLQGTLGDTNLASSLTGGGG